MLSYIIRRFLFMIPTLVGIITINFVVMQFVPGGPLEDLKEKLSGGSGGTEEVGSSLTQDGKQKELSEEEERRLKRLYNLDKPAWERYMMTLLWWAPKELAYVADIRDGGTVPVRTRGRECVMMRRGEELRMYLNQCSHSENPASIGLVGEEIISSQHGTRYSFDGQPLDDPSLKALEAVAVYSDAEQIDTPVYLDESLMASLFNWDNWHGFFLFKFGDSTQRNKNIFELILEKMPVSVRLGLVTFFLTYLVCIPLGIMKAIRNGQHFDTWSTVIVLFGYSIPGFVLAVFLLVFFSEGDMAIANLFPLEGLDSRDAPGYESWSFMQKFWDAVHHLLAPVICLTIGSFAGLTILTKNSVLDEFGKLYAVTAKAKGCSERVILLKHVLRNSLILLVTGFPASFLFMFFTGSLLIESIFNLDGIGRLGFEAAITLDYPLMLGSLFFFASLTLLAHLLRDLAYAVVDPRITYD